MMRRGQGGENVIVSNPQKKSSNEEGPPELPLDSEKKEEGV